jgi:sporulation protein YlmC with PRC-barrel domain
MTRTVYLEDLLDRRVVDGRGRPLGRIHEVVAEKHGAHYRVSEYRLGSGALIDRFSLTRWIFGRKPKPIVVPADELVITHGSAPCIAEGHGKTSD